MSTPLNRIVRTITQNAVFEDATFGVTSSTNWNQGDLLVLDTTTHLIKVAVTEATDSANFLGIAINTVVNGAPQGPYQGLATSSRVAPGYIPGPVFGVEAAMILKSGDALVFGQKVYLDVSDGPQYVSASGTNHIGVYNGPAITGNGTATVNCRLACTYLKSTLSW